jgi:hypothetical protein
VAFTSVQNWPLFAASPMTKPAIKNGVIQTYGAGDDVAREWFHERYPGHLRGRFQLKSH